MATKAKEITQIEKGIKTVKTAVKDINTKAVEVTTEVVEETVATGKQWQALLAKGLKGGTTLFGQQQDIVLTTLESLKGQYATNNVRLRKLLSFDFDFGYNFRKAETAAEEVVETAKKKVVAKATTAKKAVKKATAKAATKVEGVLETANKTVTAKATTAKKATTKTTAKVASSTKKAVKKAAATTKTAKKVTAKAVTTTKQAVKATTTAPRTKVITKNAATKIKVTTPAKDNLRTIEGIGPKIEGLLNEAGILTFKQLEDAKLITLAAILDAAGPRFRMHDPATWGAQAGMAAAGKMEELKKWQEDLKGGKITK